MQTRICVNGTLWCERHWRGCSVSEQRAMSYRCNLHVGTDSRQCTNTSIFSKAAVCLCVWQTPRPCPDEYRATSLQLVVPHPLFKTHPAMHSVSWVRIYILWLHDSQGLSLLKFKYTPVIYKEYCSFSSMIAKVIGSTGCLFNGLTVLVRQ